MTQSTAEIPVSFTNMIPSTSQMNTCASTITIIPTGKHIVTKEGKFYLLAL
jgi:hypothetical protein